MINRKAIGLLAGMILTIGSAQAGGFATYTHNRIGNFDHWFGTNGYDVTGSRNGRFENYRDNRGNTWTVYDFNSEDDD